LVFDLETGETAVAKNKTQEVIFEGAENEEDDE
jgi:hypothetical protein